MTTTWTGTQYIVSCNRCNLIKAMRRTGKSAWTYPKDWKIALSDNEQYCPKCKKIIQDAEEKIADMLEPYQFEWSPK